MRTQLIVQCWKWFPRLMTRLKGLRNNTVLRDARFMSLYLEIYRDNTALLSLRELYNLYYYAQRGGRVAGDFAELGVFRGGGAKMIASLKGERDLHLFDTFEGMPEVNQRIDSHHRPGDFSGTSASAVKRYLNAFEGIQIHPGIFPDSSQKGLSESIQFCFVHLDVDIYDSTRAGLEFFYPRLTQGGVLLSHDYRAISCPGVKRAVDEFFDDKPEEVIPLFDTQCVIRKL